MVEIMEWHYGICELYKCLGWEVIDIIIFDDAPDRNLQFKIMNISALPGRFTVNSGCLTCTVHSRQFTLAVSTDCHRTWSLCDIARHNLPKTSTSDFLRPLGGKKNGEIFFMDLTGTLVPSYGIAMEMKQGRNTSFPAEIRIFWFSF